MVSQTTISIPALAASNSPTNWVEPEVFHPERWLPATHPLYDPRFERDEKEAFRPFSTGSRNCMGSKYVATPALSSTSILSSLPFQSMIKTYHYSD